MKSIYCISGLGADHRLFCNLNIHGYSLVPVPWIPYLVNDDLVAYAHKILLTIPDPNPIIIGVSFGGMLAVEISRVKPTSRVFIISSAKGPHELKLPGGFLSKFLLDNYIMPASFFNTPTPLVFNYLGAKTPDEKQLLGQIIRDSDGNFYKWALKAIFNWVPGAGPAYVTHLHGTADKTIPSSIVHPDYWIEGGSHIMIYNRAGEIAEIIEKSLLNMTAK